MGLEKLNHGGIYDFFVSDETKVLTILNWKEFGIWYCVRAPLSLIKRDDRIPITVDH